MDKENSLISQEIISDKIYIIRNEKVMLDKDLAALFDVETRVFNQAVKRNIDRFPEDFMFQLSPTEYENLMSQFVTSSWGGTRKMPYAFTEHGIAMLSGVLKSPRAIQVNIQIIRLFTKMRKHLMLNQEVLLKLEKMDSSIVENDRKINVLFNTMKNMLDDKAEEENQVISIRKIGFKTQE